MSDIKDFSDKMIDLIASNLTDIVFMTIEDDKELMQDYLDLLQNHKRLTVNSNIAKAIKKRFKLTNSDIRNKEPQSYLIQSYKEFDV